MRRTILVATLSALVGALVATPIAVYASHSFNDVPNTNTFHDDIAWLAEAGVTRGCNPPDNTEFCPDDEVTREQMAAFMRRFAQYLGAEDGTPAQADHATTSDSATTADSAAAADSAADAAQLNGQAPEFYERPLVMNTGSASDGTQMTDQNGEIARLSISAPANGSIVLDHSSSWSSNIFDSDYLVIVWVEPFNQGAVCDDFDDGDAIAGTRTLESRDNEDAAASASGAGHVSVNAGTEAFSLCLTTFSGSSANEDWSFRAAWYPSGAFDTSSS